MRPARGVRVPEASKEPRDFQAMQLLLNAAVLAFPLILPAAILICLRIWPMRAAGQRRAMAAAWAFYGLSLAAFVAHAAGIEGVNPVQEFTLAFWGAPSQASGWCAAGWCLQALAVLALALVVNWGTLMLFVEARRRRAAGGDKSGGPAK